MGTAATTPTASSTWRRPAPRRGVGDDHVVIGDLCLDEFTDHGHCGVLDPHGRVDNDATLVRYALMAVAQARAGAHVGVQRNDGRQVRVARSALD